MPKPMATTMGSFQWCYGLVIGQVFSDCRFASMDSGLPISNLNRLGHEQITEGANHKGSSTPGHQCHFGIICFHAS